MRIVIVGLGVIGGGYAMALKEAGYSEVYGVDKNIETLKKAKALGIIKEGYEDGKDIIQSADLIVLAIYPNLVKDFIIKKDNHWLPIHLNFLLNFFKTKQQANNICIKHNYNKFMK